ncbi:MAG: ADP-ribosylglycohydrolase family protein [Anaeromyxobacteraceae bacterium]
MKSKDTRNATTPTKLAGKGSRLDLSHVRGCLLGGAVGDALGAAVEFDDLPRIRRRFGPAGLADYAPAYGREGAITDDTQMTLFTAEGLIRALHRFEGRGIASAPGAVHRAYLRWLDTQGGATPVSHFANGWLYSHKELHERRAPGNTCLSALRTGRMGTQREPLNDSKGCGGAMRIAPAGLISANDPFQLGCDLAAITHGHPSGYLAAGFLAQLLHELAAGAPLQEAVKAAQSILARAPAHEETLTAVKRAVALAKKGKVTPEVIESLGGGWVAEEAVAIGLFSALVARDFEHGVLLAVNHGGDSDSTGSIAGNILGLVQGEAGIPARWLERLELRDVIGEVAHDLWLHFGEGAPERAEPCADLDKYPGS